MLKGVTKRTIEIKMPQSQYFEGALFFIKPNPEKSSGIYRREARKFLGTINSDFSDRRLRRLHALVTVLLISLGVSLSAFLAVLILYTKTGL